MRSPHAISKGKKRQIKARLKKIQREKKDKSKQG
jgi:hypothetical protein